ncbi:uncharacterized protein LOC105197316 [Solenopsis invicta]|uniref:uncharacterized protein LOC105197316 n=1 Tax=Solenopsis invicta TaxID=13686 RepID=UPI000596245E|nr:uncharacterized protein LOC105197316 [Solenopsis invicta]
MVERFHRQLKAAIKCHENSRWTEVLPTVLLGIRAAWQEDLRATAAELVYGETFRLPGQFLERRLINSDAVDFVGRLGKRLGELRPVEGTRHGERRPFVFKDLATAECVFVRRNGPKAMLQAPYDGPYAVIRRGEKTFVVRVHDKEVTFSIDRLKPAYILAGDKQSDGTPNSTVIEPRQDDYAGNIPSAEDDTPVPREQSARVTRSGRRVRFPDRFQAGLTR